MKALASVVQSSDGNNGAAAAQTGPAELLVRVRAAGSTRSTTRSAMASRSCCSRFFSPILGTDLAGDVKRRPGRHEFKSATRYIRASITSHRRLRRVCLGAKRRGEEARARRLHAGTSLPMVGLTAWQP